VTGGAHRRSVQRHRDRDAGHRVVERQRDLRLEIRPPAGAGLRTPTTRAAAPAEHRAEQVRQITQIDGLVPATGSTAEPTRETTTPEPGRAHVADTVVRGALLRVAEDVIGGRDLLEPLLGCLVAGVRVGVVLLSELPVRLLDLRRAGVLG
jgi:hypothetical protein